MKKVLTGSVTALALVLSFGTSHAVDQNFITLDQVYDRIIANQDGSDLLARGRDFTRDPNERRSFNALPSKAFRNR